YVIGRYKEIINRGGEKVSPYEIEAAISRHPDVLQVTVFPIPVGEGNEDVGAAVVLREGTELYLKDIRRFLNGKVTAFKMPSSLYVLTQMPASDAGKVQRKMLYEKIAAMGIPAQPLADANEPIIAPRNETEFKLYKIFRTILPVKEISVTDTFFELGGDSLKTVLLFNHIRRVFGTQIPVTYILNNSSIEDLAGYISKKQNNENIYNFVVPFNKEGTKTPLFFVHAADGTPAVCMNLAKDFDPDRPFYGFYFNHNAVEWKHPITFEQIAAEYIKDIRTIQPEGPYVINGHCLGGILAYEIAQQLSQAGQQIALLGMFDTIISKIQKEREEDAEGDNVQANNSTLMGYLRLKARKIKIYLMVDGSMFIYKITPNFMRSVIVKYLNREALLRYSRRRYEPKEYKGKMIYFKPEKSKASSIESIKLWQGINSKVEVIKLKGDHGSMFSVQNAWYTRDVLNNLLDKISNN
ncbi:MAG: thioesterase domain-containing protein, partial [Syntrophomonadaceae bacterium]|nr:thioesterase domain-containing protein [Syntrophomonadaceae bacterium]